MAAAKGAGEGYYKTDANVLLHYPHQLHQRGWGSKLLCTHGVMLGTLGAVLSIIGV